MGCICCGAKLLVGGLCNETFLCGRGECFLRWVTSDEAGKDINSLETHICADWKSHHMPNSPESD